MIVRPEVLADHAAVAEVVARAFADEAHATLVGRLRCDPSYRPDRALVAVVDDRVVGFVMVTDSTVTAPDGSTDRLATLSPLAVDPDHQRRGLGSALVEAAAERCGADAEPALVLEGDPAFYGRLGFTPAGEHGLVLPLPVWASAEAAQVRVLGGPVPAGVVRYARAFDEFEG